MIQGYFERKIPLKLVDFGSLALWLLLYNDPSYLTILSDLALEFMALRFFNPNIKGHLLTLIQHNISSIEVSMNPTDDKNFHLKNEICARSTCFANTRFTHFNKGGFHMKQ